MIKVIRSVFFFAGLFTATLGFSQEDAISKYFDQYVNDERFTVVYISSKMFDMFAKMDIDEMASKGDQDAKVAMDVIKDLKGLRILTTEETPEKYYKEALRKIDTNGYETLMKVRSDDGENVQFFVKDNGGDIINELLLLAGGDEFVLLSFMGNISLKKIGKLAKMMDVKGAEHLEELEKNQHKKQE